MQKLKAFLKTPTGMVVLVLVGLVVVMAYASKIPGVGLLRTAAAKLPGSDLAPAIPAPRA